MPALPAAEDAVGKGLLIYPRHFAALGVVAALLLTAGHEYRPHNAFAAAAVYGTLYSSVTAMSLRSRYAMRRRLSFVAAAIALSCLSFSISFYGGRLLGWSSPIGYLVICAGAGAVAYALLLRWLLMADLSPRAVLLIPLVSVLAVVAVLLSGLYARNIDALAIGWWFAFSAGLWFDDHRSTRVFQAGIH